MSILVDIQHVSKKYKDAPRAAVNDLSLTINKGDVFGLLGPNGAGKTSIISTITGLYACSDGNAWIAGYDIRTNMREV